MLRFIFLISIFISISIAELNAAERSGFEIDKSDIFVMYNNNDFKKVQKFRVDNVSWGSQIGYTRESFNFSKEALDRNKIFGIKSSSIDIALIQEGGKYVICGDIWNVKCDKQYWQLRKNRDLFTDLVAADSSIIERAVIGAKNQIVGVPWLASSGKLVPMANVNDPGYKKWIIRKVDMALSLKPDVVHFDEVYMEVASLTKRKTFIVTQFELDLFVEFLRKKSSKIKLNSYVINFKKNPDVWAEFVSFKYASAINFIADITSYIKTKTNNRVLVSGNFSPASWMGTKVSAYFDVIVSEIPHIAKSRNTSSIPLYVYKMANGLNKTVIATAQGGDWSVIKHNNYTNLVSSWIAQAYALDQFMNFPLKAWIPGSSFTPTTDEYSNVASWIKDNAQLFDDSTLINTAALIVDSEILLNYRKREKLKSYVTDLIENGVLFRVVFDSNELTVTDLVALLKNYNDVLLPFDEYMEENKKEQIYSNLKNVFKGVLSATELSKHTRVSSVGFVGGEKIYIFPKQSDIDKSKYLIHVLNRNFNSSKNKMNAYSNAILKLDHKLISDGDIKKVMLNQPGLIGNSLSSLNVKTDIPFFIESGSVYLEIPIIYLWGIIEIVLNN